MNELVGETNSTWSSFADSMVVMASMPSPPGRFSTTTGWPHFCDSLSANMRAPMSTPLPAPSVTMKRTGRVGQASAAAAGLASSGLSASAAVSAPKIIVRSEIVIVSSTCRPAVPYDGRSR